MALKLKKTIDNSVVVLRNNQIISEKTKSETNEFYVKIIKIDGNMTNINITVLYYIDNNPIDGKVYNFVPSLDGENFVKQAYEHLKTLEEFKNAEDC